MQHKELKSKVGKSATKIWDAYQEVLAELNSGPSDPQSTVAVAKEVKVKKAVKISEAVSIEGIESTVTTLLQSVSEAKDAYDEIQTAIDAKKDELKDVHALEVEANSLVALVATKEAMVEEYKLKSIGVLENAREFEKETYDKLRKEAIKEREALAFEITNAKEVQEREKSEWEYKFQRTKEKLSDELQDELADRMKGVAEREAERGNKEDTLESLEEKIVSLNLVIDQMVVNKQTEIDTAVDVAKNKANKSAAIARSYDEKSHASEISISNANIDNLKEQVIDLKIRLENTEARVQVANTKLAEMANNALRAGADAATVAKVSEIAAGGGKK